MTPRIAPRRPAHGNQARAERTCALAVDETVRCVLDEGFAAASAKHIAERAGMTWGTIQYHFGDRDGLLMAVVDRAFDDLLATLRALPPPAPETDTRQRATQVVNVAWEAMWSATSRAAIEILIGTRATRATVASKHLNHLAKTFAALGGAVGADLDAT